MEGYRQDVLFRRIVHPSFDPVEHVAKLGIQLRSTSKRPCTPRSLRMISAKSSLSNRAKSSTSRFTPQTSNIKHVFNVVVPISAPDDDYNVRTSNTPHSFSADRSRSQSGTLPHMMKSVCASPRLTSARSNKSTKTNVTFCLDTSKNSSADTHKELSSYPQKYPNRSGRWRNKDQPQRFQQEQENLTVSRHRGTSSQNEKNVKENERSSLSVRPHRVDRMYYMFGTGLNMGDKYQVNEKELRKLRELADERRSRAYYGRGLSRYKYFELPTETHLPDAFKNGQSPIWYTSDSPDSDMHTIPRRIETPGSDEQYVKYIDEDHSVFARLTPYYVGMRSNRNNSARNSVDFTDEMMKSLQLNSDGGSSICESYVPYRLSRTDVYDAGSDEISIVTAENRVHNDNNNPSKILPEIIYYSDKGKLQQRVCTTPTDGIGEENTNNNASGTHDLDNDVLGYDCAIQSTKRNGYPSLVPCAHKKREIQCTRCGHKKPNLNVKDVKFTSWVSPPQRMVIVAPERNGERGRGGVLFRYSSNSSTKTSRDQWSSRGTPDLSQHRVGPNDIIKVVYDANGSKIPPLPQIAKEKNSFYMRTPSEDLSNPRTPRNVNGSRYDVMLLPILDRSPNAIGSQNDGVQKKKEKVEHKEREKDKKQHSPKTLKRGTFVKNDTPISSVKMQVLPPQYRNSINGSFIPHSLLRAAVPTLTNKQRIEKQRKEESKTPTAERIMVEIQLSTPTGGVRIYRQNNYNHS